MKPTLSPASAAFRYKLTRIVYTFLLCCLLPLVVLVFKKKLRHIDGQLPNRSFWERFGKVSHLTQTGGIHLHCVSVGEVNAASGLIYALLDEYPDLPITLTTSSTTGAVHAASVFKERVQHSYLPVDIPWVISRFYRKVQPRLVLVTEVEVWPNMLNICQKMTIPTVLINARMTDKSLISYKRFSWLFRRTFRQFSLISAQSSQSFENFLAYGVYKRQLKLSKNMKFDLSPDDADEQLGQQLLRDYKLAKRPILLGASTHDPEEKMLLAIYKKLKIQHSNLLLVIVPRHPQRFDDVHQLMKATGYRVASVSQGNIKDKNAVKSSNITNNSIDCLLVDKMGWLKACYSICTVAFVGGSFAPKGGHNALEAALYSKPIVMGNSIFNNPTICQHLAAQKALKITHTSEALYKVCDHWLSNKEQADHDGENGLQVLLKNAGSVEYTMSLLRPLL